MFKISKYQGNTNQIHNEIQLCTHQDGCNQREVITSAGKEEKLKSSNITAGQVNSAATLESALAIPQNGKQRFTTRPSKRYTPTKMKTCPHKNYIQVFIAALLIIAKKQKQFKRPLTDERVKVIYPYNVILISNKKE